MPQPLPRIGSLLRDSWTMFLASWNDTIKVTIWFLYYGLINFALMVLIKYMPFARLLALPVLIFLIFLMLWIVIRVLQITLQIEDGKKPTVTKEDAATAWRLLPSFIWIMFLQTLIILGGTLLFVIPGIYLSLALNFSMYFLLTDNLRGIKALQASRELVKGRWWGTFWRLFVGGLAFGASIGILTSILSYIILSIAGPEHLLAVQQNRAVDPLINGTLALFQSIVQAATIPLLSIFQVKIFRALQKTK